MPSNGSKKCDLLSDEMFLGKYVLHVNYDDNIAVEILSLDHISLISTASCH